MFVQGHVGLGLGWSLVFKLKEINTESSSWFRITGRFVISIPNMHLYECIHGYIYI